MQSKDCFSHIGLEFLETKEELVRINVDSQSKAKLSINSKRDPLDFYENEAELTWLHFESKTKAIALRFKQKIVWNLFEEILIQKVRL